MSLLPQTFARPEQGLYVPGRVLVCLWRISAGGEMKTIIKVSAVRETVYRGPSQTRSFYSPNCLSSTRFVVSYGERKEFS